MYTVYAAYARSCYSFPKFGNGIGLMELSARGSVAGEEDIGEVFILGAVYSGNGGAVPQIEGSFDWIAEGEGPQAEEFRSYRLEAARLTAAACRLGRYCINEEEIPLLSLPDLLGGTHLITRADTGKPAATYATQFLYHDSAETPLTDVMTLLDEQNMPFTLLSAGNAYSVGGNFSTGGAVFAEEALCMQSTLHLSLRRAAKMAEENGVAAPRWAKPTVDAAGKPWQVYIPELGAVLSPRVEIFRTGPEDGFAFLERPLQVAFVITTAMPTCNPEADYPIDAPEDIEEYHRIVEAKIAAALEVAMQLKSQVLVVPELGCGWQGNDPRIIGERLASVISSRFPTAFSEVHFVGDEVFLMSCSRVEHDIAGSRNSQSFADTILDANSGMLDPQMLDGPSPDSRARHVSDELDAPSPAPRPRARHVSDELDDPSPAPRPRARHVSDELDDPSPAPRARHVSDELDASSTAPRARQAAAHAELQLDSFSSESDSLSYDPTAEQFATGRQEATASSAFADGAQVLSPNEDSPIERQEPTAFSSLVKGGRDKPDKPDLMFRPKGIEQACLDFVEEIEACQQTLSRWSNEDLRREWEAAHRQAKELQDECASVAEQRCELEKGQAELIETREQLLQQLHILRAAPKGSCCIC